MRLKNIVSILLLFMSVSVYPQEKMEKAERQQEYPHLLVGIKIEGLKSSYLNEWWKSFSIGGFRKITAEGVTFENVRHDLVSSGNAPDVATFVTGCYPVYHGISSDFYFDKKKNKIQSILFDPDQTGIGTAEQCSPQNLLASTLTDEILLKNHFAKIHSIAIDKENAVLLAGHNATSATWFEDVTKKWVTTAYYTKGLSKSADVMNVNGDTKKTVSKNTLVTNLALNTFENEMLGMNKNTDALMIQYSLKLSNTATVGANDEMNNYQDVDLNLQRLIRTITSILGTEKVLFFIVGSGSDEFSPDDLIKNRIPAGYFNADKAMALLNTYLMAIYGQEKWILGYCGKNIFLNKEKIESKKLNVEEFQNRLSDFLTEFEGVQAAYSVSQIRNFGNNMSDSRSKIANSYHKNSGGDIVISLMPGWVEIDKKGNIVGESNVQQTYVPFYLFGGGLKTKKINTECQSIDIAPTICNLLGIPFPNACTGKAILQVNE